MSSPVADNLRLNIGALRGAMQLSCIPANAHAFGHGRARSDERADIGGLNGLIAIMSKMKRGAEQDDPYADWWMMKIQEGSRVGRPIDDARAE